MKYTDDQIFGIFDHKSSGIHHYLEDGGKLPPKTEIPEKLEPMPKEEKNPGKQEELKKNPPEYRTIEIGDDKIDIDLENELIYINDELVTPETDAPKHIIDVLAKIVPKIVKKAEGEEAEDAVLKEEAITEEEKKPRDYASDAKEGKLPGPVFKDGHKYTQKDNDEIKDAAQQLHYMLAEYFPQDDEEYIFNKVVSYYRKNYLR